MRRFAWLLVIAILGIVLAVGNSYLRQKLIAEQNAPKKPAPLPMGLSAKTGKWEWANNQGDKVKSLIRASGFREIKDPPSTELEGLELLLYDQTGTKYDLVESPSARFTKGDRVLFSEGEVRITMGIPEDGPKPNRVLEIKSSAVRFELATNKATTDKPVWFRFGQGEGKSIGADYDPNLRELNLRSAVELTWHGAKTMQVQAGEALYKELESKVYLKPWAKLTRESLVLNAQDSIVMLEKGIVRQVDATRAVGTDQQKGRSLEFGADSLRLMFNAKGQAEKVEGNGTARLASTNDRERTVMNARRVELNFAATQKDSTLERAFAQGEARVEAKPMPRSKVAPVETKVLASDSIEMKMRPGGEEIERLETHDPGVIELLPNLPTQRKRRLEGERIHMLYGKNNMLERLRSVKSTTRTEPAAEPVQKPPALPMVTSSQDLEAFFSPVNGELARLEQWTNFKYQQGAKQATAERASLEQAKNEIRLTGKARVWDPTGSTDADRIQLDQKSGDFTAEGQVRSVREGERKQAAGGLMTGGEPVRATANQMSSKANNTQVRYEGRAVMWQGANRLSADRIDIDRPKQILKANGQVVSQILDQKASTQGTQVFTLVRAPELTYSDKDQFAHYRGGALMTRPGLQVKGQELRAYLSSNENSESNWEAPNGGLEKAFADGKVEIVETRDTKSRQGWGDHAEYYVGEARLVLEGTRPRMVDLLAGVPQRTTEGKSMVWFANNDRLIVDGEESKRAVTNLVKKK